MPTHIISSSSLSHSSVEPLTLDDLERHLLQSPTVARWMVFGLPALGVLASLLAELPLFAVLMAGCFLLATALVCRRPLIRFTSHTLRLLVAARLVLILVLAALLFCATGVAWMGVVSALLLWLVADRLLGPLALRSLGNRTRVRRATVAADATDALNHCPASVQADADEPAFTPGSAPADTEAGAVLFPPVERDDDASARPRRRKVKR